MATIDEMIEAYHRLKAVVDEMRETWDGWTWQKGFNPTYYSQLCDLEEVLYGKSIS